MSKSLISQKLIGTSPEGKEIYQFTLKNRNGITAKILNLGGIITSLEVPDKKGKADDIVLGYDNLDQYFSNPSYFNAIIGRYANRIAKGKYTLEGTEYSHEINNGINHLHGGKKGFDKQVWDFSLEETKDSSRLMLNYLSVDGEEGYPGNLNCTVTFILNGNDELIIDYKAETDKTTHINLTHHSYFNLAGAGNGNVFNHLISINSEKYTIADDDQITTGEIATVKGTPFDFLAPHTIGSRIDKLANGYDHNFVLKNQNGAINLAAIVMDPISGRRMDVFTTEPGVQFYTGFWINPSEEYKAGKKYDKFSGFCLETQHYPNTPNQPEFPSTLLKPGEIFSSRTIHKFSKI